MMILKPLGIVALAALISGIKTDPVLTAVQCPSGCSCPSLAVLNCSHSGLTTLPPGEFHDGLQDIYFSYNMITSIEANTMKRMNITVLVNANFSHNKIEYVDVKAFSGQVHLKHLDLSWNQLSWIHSLAFNFEGVHLDWLSLAGNPELLLYKSGRFIRSPFLTFLNMSHCNISRIPDETFAGVPDIRTLDLSHNRLTLITSAMLSELFHLEDLDLSQNQLGLNYRALDLNVFSNSLRLKRLNLSYNQLSCVHLAAFGNLASLTYLDVRFNPMIQSHSVDVSSQYLFHNSSKINMDRLEKHNCERAFPTRNGEKNNNQWNYNRNSEFSEMMDPIISSSLNSEYVTAVNKGKSQVYELPIRSDHIYLIIITVVLLSSIIVFFVAFLVSSWRERNSVQHVYPRNEIEPLSSGSL